jgi:hypothetical protein
MTSLYILSSSLSIGLGATRKKTEILALCDPAARKADTVLRNYISVAFTTLSLHFRSSFFSLHEGGLHF